jgi:metal-responsive CopG/Arc/MetJ family transcriptional regulator
MPAGFPAGTFAEMDEVLEPNETRKDLVRTAVRNELARRKKRKPKQPPSNDKD